jgi:hypothetical protein
MVDLMAVANKGYYVQGSGGSTSIKRLLLPSLRFSPLLKDLYSSPTYSGSNFTDFTWWRRESKSESESEWQEQDGSGWADVRDPYKLLAQADADGVGGGGGGGGGGGTVADGGAAVAAYQVLQSGDISLHEREVVQRGLRRYCELDTLAMVMIVQAWRGFLARE